MLTKSKPADAKKFFAQSQADADRRWKFYQSMAQRDPKPEVAPTLKSATGPETEAPTPTK